MDKIQNQVSQAPFLDMSAISNFQNSKAGKGFLDNNQMGMKTQSKQQ